MSLRHLVQLRKFSTTRILRESFLSSDYKSKKLWDERLNCGLLCDETIIKSINTKIITGKDLSNWEIDIFINISTPLVDEIAQLQESVKLLRKFRKSLYSHLLLPSTPHAVCRLFLYSQRLVSSITLLENRVNYGVFPDFFSFNLLLDQAIDDENYMAASRLANLLRIQEEFGVNPIADKLSLLSVARYIESKTNFEDWLVGDHSEDPIFTEDSQKKPGNQKDEEATKKEEEEEGDDDEDEEDAEYIRVPFLRNPYFDNHFDVTNPRVICGKILTILSRTFANNSPDISARCKLIGYVLQGKWLEASDLTNKFVQAKIDLGPLKDLAKFYVENLHGLDELSEDKRANLVSILDTIPESSSQSLAGLAHMECKNLSASEERDIKQLTEDLKKWSLDRQASRQREEDRLFKAKLKFEIEAKKEELRLKEQYLYFYDNLKKSRATKIEYN